MTRTQRQAQYKGLNFHLHVTITKKQLALLRRLAKRKGISLSRVVRDVIDEWEAAR